MGIAAVWSTQPRGHTGYTHATARLTRHNAERIAENKHKQNTNGIRTEHEQNTIGTKGRTRTRKRTKGPTRTERRKHMNIKHTNRAHKAQTGTKSRPEQIQIQQQTRAEQSEADPRRADRQKHLGQGPDRRGSDRRDSRRRERETGTGIKVRKQDYAESIGHEKGQEQAGEKDRGKTDRRPTDRNSGRTGAQKATGKRIGTERRKERSAERIRQQSKRKGWCC